MKTLMSDVTDLARRPLVSLLSDLVSIDSCDPPGHEQVMAKRIVSECERNGISCEVDEFAPGRVNVLARLSGRGHKPPLMFSAHMDTVPVGEAAWSREPFSGQIDGDRLYGRGASDMKSGLAAMLGAMVSLSGEPPLAGDILLALTAGESSNCLGAKRFVDRGSIADCGAILVSEPTSLQVIVAEMAALWVRVVVVGRIGHISGDGGVNAILETATFLTGLEELDLPALPHDLLPLPSVTVGKIAGGSAVNVTPDRCEVMLDLRLRPGTGVDEALLALRKFLPEDAQVEVADFKPAVETSRDHPFVMACREECARTLGHEAEVGGVSYYSDATIFNAAYGTPFAIVGPGELGMSGQSDEWVSIRKFEAATEIFAGIARRWLA